MRSSSLLPSTMPRAVERAIVWTTVVATIAWSLGISFLVRVPFAHAGVPTYSGGGPPTGQSFVPPDALVDVVASEALTAGTVTTANVTLLECTGTTDPASCPATTGSNLCTSVTLGADSEGNSNRKITCTHDPLGTEKVYRFRVSTSVTSSSTSDPAAANLDRIFKTSGFSGGSGGNFSVPPQITRSTPAAGATNFPVNGKLVLEFPLSPEGNMKTGASTAGSVQNHEHFTLRAVTNQVAGGADLCVADCTFVWNATSRVLTIDPSALTAGTEYELNVSGLQNQSNVAMPGQYFVRFTAAASDSTAPGLRTTGTTTNPTSGATGTSRYTPEFVIFLTEVPDPATVTIGTTVGLFADADTSSTMNGAETMLDGTALTMTIDQAGKAIRMGSKTALSANTRYCFRIVGGDSGVKDSAGNTFQSNGSSDQCFTTGSDADNAGAKLMFADADNFKLVAKFSEPLNATDAVDTSKYTLECPVGVAISLSGKTLTYRPDTKEVEIQGLGMQPGQSCRLTVAASTRDLAGNNFDTSSSNNVANFFILNSSTTGGFLGTSGVQDFSSTNFATFAEKPQRCQPKTTASGKPTTLECEFPNDTGSALAADSKFILTFPSGFTFSTSDGATRAIPAAQSILNTDINGSASGVPVISGVAIDATAGTVTVTTGTASIANGDMIHFELDRLTTPSTAASDLRISIVRKDANGVKIGSTVSASPFSINAAGALTASGTVCKGSSAGGACAGGDTGIANVKVYCDQMGGFSVGGSTAGMMGRQDAKTDVNGDWSITGLTNGKYGCSIPPDPTNLADVGGMAPFQEVNLSGSNKADVDFKYTDLSSSGKSLTITVSGLNDADSDADDFDVFCHAGFTSFENSAPIMKAVDAATAGNTTATLKLQGGKTYECGMGPHIAFENFGSGAPPPPPTFDFMPPKPQQVVVPASSDPTGITFALQTTNRTVTGTVVDGSSTGIANVFVHAQPVGCFDATSGEAKECFGSFAQSKSDGTFTLNIADGTYEIGADGPGLPPSTREIVTANGASVSNVTLKMVKASTTVAGSVLDESGNGIKYAHVNAEKRTITSGTDACDFANSRPAGGFADAPTDESGNYVLYLGNGTYCVRAFAPTYGEVKQMTVTMAGTSLTGQNLQASTASFGTISGTLTKASVAVSGAFVNCFSPGVGGNGGATGTDGTFSLKVKIPSSGSANYSCDAFAPGIGPLGRGTATLSSGASTATVNFSVGNPGTITVTVANITDAFCDARDSSGLGAAAGNPTSAGVYTINVPAGTYTVRCSGPKYGVLVNEAGIAVTAGGTATVTGSAPTTRAVTGRITDGSNNLPGATAKFTDTTGKSFIVNTGSQSGSTANLSTTGIAEGTYTVMVSKKGYEPATTTATVSGGNLTMASAIALTPASGGNGTTVTIPVQESGSDYTGTATVIATKSSGGVTKTMVGDMDSTTGDCSLALTNGTWTVKAIGDNGKESSTSTVTVSGGVVSGSAPTLSLATSITGYTAKNGSENVALSTGGLLKFEDLAVGSGSSAKSPEINVPASTLSTSDSSNGKIEMKSDATLAGIDPGADENFVGSSGYDITPKDASGNEIKDLNGTVTITIPYTDADVASAGVEESQMTLASFDTASQTWETFPTTVDATNNLLVAEVSHFSSFGVIGAQSSGSTGSGDATPPAAPSSVQATATASKATITWTDPGDSDFLEVEVLRNTPPSTAVNATPIGKVAKGVQKYEDLTVLPSKAYTYVLRAKDTSGNTRNSAEITVTTPASESAAPTTGTTAPTTGGGAPATGTTTTTPPATTTTTAPTLPDGIYVNDRVRTASSGALYLVASNGKRYLYPNETIYKSWHADFAGVKRVSDAQMAAIPLGGIVTVRQGTWLVKIESDPKVYAIESNGVRRWIETEARARLLYGANWNRMILDIPVSYWNAYPEGQPLGANVHPKGTVVRTTDGLQTFFMDMGKKRAVSAAAFSGLAFQERFVRTLDPSLSYETGNALLTSSTDASPIYWQP